MIATFLIFIASLQPIIANYQDKVVQIINISPSANPEVASLSLPGGVVIKQHRMTANEIEVLKSQTGVDQFGDNYNQIINGYGTGLRPPTSAELNAISQSSYVIDNVSSSNTPSSFDNSDSSYFPPIGNQAGQGSCVAWSVGYYIATFQEARAYGWNLTGASWNGEQPTLNYQNKVISPAFVYNLGNNGLDQGTSFPYAMDLVCSIGACTWARMPWTQSDYTTWPSEAAWTEAPLYRGNSSGCQYMFTADNNSINSLKNLLSSEILVSIAIDPNEFGNLTKNDVWTMDNYFPTNNNHAGTIVGYDDNFSYNESGQVKYGAFKVANSWGVGFWENVPDGYYWISYSAMEQREITACWYYFPQSNYQPSLLSTFKLNDSARGNCLITVGLGNPTDPVATKSFSAYRIVNDVGTEPYVRGGNQPFCSNNIVMDISEFKTYMSSQYNQSFFLQVYDNQAWSTANGTILDFAIGNWSASGTPCSTLKGQNVFVNVTYNPYVNSSITLLPANESSPLSTNNYFPISYYLNGQNQTANASNGTLLLTVDGGTNMTISGLSNGSNSTEQWVLNSQDLPVTFPTGSNVSLYYYDLLSQHVCYSANYNAGLFSPMMFYYTAPPTQSSQLNQDATSIMLPSITQQTIMALKGTKISVSNDILYIVPPILTAQAKWATPTSNWIIVQPNQVPNPITYYYQYQINTTYTISDGSTPPWLPILSGKQFGTNYQLSVKTSNQTTWLDANTIWLLNSTLRAPSGIEQWICNESCSGNLSGATVMNQTYFHQYYLVVNSPHGISTGQGWYNNGASTQAVVLSNDISGESGIQYVFSCWTGEASGSRITSDSIIMNSPKTATAIWTTQYQLTFETIPSGSASTTLTGVNLWVNSGLLSITASPNSGYTFSQWTADSSSITFENSSSVSTIANVDGPGKITASLTLLPTSTPAPTTAPTATSTIAPTTTPTSTLKPTTPPTPAPTTSPSPTPTPEFPSFMILIILMIVFTPAVALIVRRQRKARA